MPNNRWTICVTCRKGWRGSATCKHETRVMHRDFRMPKRRDDRAWARLERGENNTERSVVDQHYREQEDALWRRRQNPVPPTGGLYHWAWGGVRSFWVSKVRQ